MVYSITPGAFNWGAQPSGQNFGLPYAAPAPVDYSSYLAPDIGTTDTGLSFGNTGSGNAMTTPTFSTPAARGAAYDTKIGAGMNAAGQATFNASDNAGTNAPAVDGPNWLGKNIGTIKSVADILQGFGSLYGAFQTNNIAKDTLKFQKKSYETNLANSIKSYNLALDDRIRSRYAQNERSTADADAKIAENQL